MLPKATHQRERRIEGKKFYLSATYDTKSQAKWGAKHMRGNRKGDKTFQYRIIPVQYNHLRGLRTGYALYTTYKASNLA
jgi:hypothetical protein